MTLDPDALRKRLAALIARHKVPGAALAVLTGGEVTEAASGVLNQATGVEATTDSLFQIGSITKVYTATVVMGLVEEGKLALDEPLVTYLPEFAVADPDVTKQVTLRHLLTHSSGIDGDHFADTGRGDDCMERYIESLAGLRQNHPLGATMSYCNAGYGVLGRIIEKVTDSVWDRALRARLIEPLALTHTVTLPEEALRYRTALGHVAEPGDDPHPSPVWGLMRSAGPAGLVCSTAADVITFARLHMDGGVAPDGTRLLSEAGTAAMQEPQVAVPNRWTLGDHWGLGWILFDWGGQRLYGHDGSTIGQSAFLRIAPDASVAVALLTNGGHTGDLYRELFRGLFAELAGIELPTGPEPPTDPVSVDLAGYAGLYERASARIEISAGGGVLDVTATVTGELAALVPNPVQHLTFIPVDPSEHLFVTRTPDTESWVPAVFFKLEDGSPYLHFGARATPKVA